MKSRVISFLEVGLIIRTDTAYLELSEPPTVFQESVHVEGLTVMTLLPIVAREGTELSAGVDIRHCNVPAIESEILVVGKKFVNCVKN
jgi:hypothetical protein